MPDRWLVLAVVLATSNLVALALVGWDKRCASAGRRRVPEASLIGLVWLGALPGVLVGMRLFRHKTVKRRFQVRLAVVTVLWAASVYGILALALGPDPRAW